MIWVDDRSWSGLLLILKQIVKSEPNEDMIQKLKSSSEYVKSKGLKKLLSRSKLITILIEQILATTSCD